MAARAFREGKPVGTTSRLDFPVHKGSQAKIRYLSPFLDYKDAAGYRALADYNYASLTVGDDNWQGFGTDFEVVMEFEELTQVSEIEITNLRYTISGVYVPKTVIAYGSSDGVNFEKLVELDRTEESEKQGRNKVTTSLSFPAVEVKALKIFCEALSPIPEGHHRAGESGKIYLDEIVIL